MCGVRVLRSVLYVRERDEIYRSLVHWKLHSAQYRNGKANSLLRLQVRHLRTSAAKHSLALTCRLSALRSNAYVSQAFVRLRRHAKNAEHQDHIVLTKLYTMLKVIRTRLLNRSFSRFIAAKLSTDKEILKLSEKKAKQELEDAKVRTLNMQSGLYKN